MGNIPCGDDSFSQKLPQQKVSQKKPPQQKDTPTKKKFMVNQDEVTESFIDLVKAMIQKVQDIEKEKGNLDREIKGHLFDVTHLKFKLNKLEKKSKKRTPISVEIGKKTNTIEYLQQQLKDKESEDGKLEKIMEKLKGKVERHKQFTKELRKKNKELETKLEDFDHNLINLEKVSKTKTIIENENEELRKINQNLKNQAVDLENDNTGLYEDVEQLNNENKKLKEDVKRLLKDNAQTQMQMKRYCKFDSIEDDNENRKSL